MTLTFQKEVAEVWFTNLVGHAAPLPINCIVRQITFKKYIYIRIVVVIIIIVYYSWSQSYTMESFINYGTTPVSYQMGTLVTINSF